MLDETINAYREAVLGPVIDVMKEEIASTNDPDKKNDRTAQMINNIAFEWIQNREYPEAVDILELEEQFDKD